MIRLGSFICICWCLAACTVAPVPGTLTTDIATEQPEVTSAPKRDAQIQATSQAAPLSAEPNKPAEPAPSELLVVASKTIAGFWRVRVPAKLSISLGSATYSEVSDNICRFDTTGGRLRAICLPHLSRRGLGEGTDDGDRFRVTWSSGIETISLAGIQDRPGHLKGALSAGMLGLGMTGNIPASGLRITPDPNPASDRDAKAAMIGDILADLAHGQRTAGRYTADLATTLGADPPFGPAELATLGPIQALVAIGTVDVPATTDDPAEHYDIYDVEFASDHRICGIDLTKDGAATRFQCR